MNVVAAETGPVVVKPEKEVVPVDVPMGIEIFPSASMTVFVGSPVD